MNLEKPSAIITARYRGRSSWPCPEESLIEDPEIAMLAACSRISLGHESPHRPDQSKETVSIKNSRFRYHLLAEETCRHHPLAVDAFRRFNRRKEKSVRWTKRGARDSDQAALMGDLITERAWQNSPDERRTTFSWRERLEVGAVRFRRRNFRYVRRHHVSTHRPSGSHIRVKLTRARSAWRTRERYGYPPTRASDRSHGRDRVPSGRNSSQRSSR